MRLEWSDFHLRFQGLHDRFDLCIELALVEGPIHLLAITLQLILDTQQWPLISVLVHQVAITVQIEGVLNLTLR